MNSIPQKKSVIHAGLIGFGTVGEGVYKHWHRVQEHIQNQYGVELVLSKIAVRDLSKKRNIPLPENLLIDDLQALVEDPEISIIIELMGGVELPRELILKALSLGKRVITANKALLCEHGAEIFCKAVTYNTACFFEASVCAGLPVIKLIREGLVANHLLSLTGIVNGSTNYILTELTSKELPMSHVLEKARQLGYLEANDALDLDGWDVAHKAIILAYLAFGIWFKKTDIVVEGIRSISLEDVQVAKKCGFKIKLLASIITDMSSGKKENEPFYLENSFSLKASIRVQPCLVAPGHRLYTIDGPLNALAIQSDLMGEVFISGCGAGQDATASGVLADVVDAVKSILDFRISANLDRDKSINTSDQPSVYLMNPEQEEIAYLFYVALKNEKDFRDFEHYIKQKKTCIKKVEWISLLPSPLNMDAPLDVTVDSLGYAVFQTYPLQEMDKQELIQFLKKVHSVISWVRFLPIYP